MTSTIITDYVGRGTHAARPVSPPISSGAGAFYYETDTGISFTWTGSAWIGFASGTVTSVAMTVPGELSLTGSPITSGGTFALSWSNETGNVVLASPSGGGSGTPGFRNLVPGDIPNLDTSKLTTGTLSLARLSGITTTQLSATAGVVAGQIASVNPSVLTGSGTVPLTALTGITTTQLSSTAGIVSGQIASIPNQNASIITAGTLATARGGTGVNASAASNGQLLIGNGSGLTLATLTAGSNITITNASGTITIASTGGGGGGASSEAIPGGYLSAFILRVHNGFTSTLGGSTTIPVSTGGTDYVVQAHFTGATSTSINSGVLDTVNFTDVAVFYNNAGTWQQIDIDYDIDTRGAWGSSNVTLWFKLQTPILAGADSPALGSGSYILCYGHTVPTVMRNWDNIYPLSDPFSGVSLDVTKWTSNIPTGSSISVSSGNLDIGCTTGHDGDAYVNSLVSYGSNYAVSAAVTCPLLPSSSGFTLGFRNGVGTPFTDYSIRDTAGSNEIDVREFNGGVAFTSIGTNNAAQHVIALARSNTDLAYGSTDAGSWVAVPSGQEFSNSLPVGFLLDYHSNMLSGTDVLVTWVKVRPWVSTEPTVTATAVTGTGRGGDTTITELLFYPVTTDVLNNFIPTNGVWTNVFADQSFTVAHSTSIVEYLLFGNIYQTPQYGAVRLLVDGVTPYHIAGGTGAGNMCLNCRIPVTGLSAGAHTIRAQIFTNSGSGFFLRVASNESEFFDLHVLELF